MRRINSLKGVLSFKEEEMESNIPRLLIFIFFILPAPLCAEASYQNISRVVQIYHLAGWFGARAHCRTYHTELVIIRNTEEANSLKFFDGWIGLKQRYDGVWKWSQDRETASFFYWHPDEQYHSGCVLKYSSSPKWRSADCYDHNRFLCINENMILVQEMKTWEEALLHCRELSSALNSPYDPDLTCLPESHTFVWNKEKIAETVTDEVWIGLRFLAGRWVWTDGSTVTSSYLPGCPAQDQHCGALDRNNSQWKTLSCIEKRHFLCSF